MIAPQPRHPNGFTLVELLVSIAILSLTATLLLSGVTTASVLARDTGRDAHALDEVAAAQTILRNRISLLRPVKRLDLSQPLMDVSGNERVFEFYSVPASGSREGGVHKYRLMLTSPGDLVLYHMPELTDRVDPRALSVVGWKPITLVDGASTLSISYFGATPADPQRKWRSFWRDNAAAPELVRVRVGFAASDPRAWPELVVRPGPTVDLGCDPETGAKSCGPRG